MKKRITFLAILMTFTMVFTMGVKAAGLVDEMNAVKKTPAKLGEFVSKFNLKVPNEKGELKDYKFKYVPKVMNDKSSLAVYDIVNALGKKSLLGQGQQTCRYTKRRQRQYYFPG